MEASVSSLTNEFTFFRYDRPPSAGALDRPAVTVKRDAFWSYCGPALAPNPDDLPADLHEWMAVALSGSILPLLEPFLRFLREFLARSGLRHYWLTIRATTPTAEYDMARWHTDDLFFAVPSTLQTPSASSPLSLSSLSSRHSKILRPRKPGQSSSPHPTDWKLCTTLLGPTTMFVPHRHQAEARRLQASARAAHAVDHACTQVRCVGCASAADAVRSALAVRFVGFGAVQASQGECAVLRTGKDGGAVHSEPRMSEGEGESESEGQSGRIFVNVVPGSEEELRGLAVRWGMEFPRSWWLGSKAPPRSFRSG
ncbi:hypothetical protein BX600DRAFT_517841 [Xylariales sp. PMI_506]|nr:hypothetical protein BX600DRAFT_517841 [Xylariales sp. PMI_506]